MSKEEVKVLIIGSGPAGYTAAIYAARAGLKPVLYTGAQPGGQLTTTNDVENFPGYPKGINGPEMMIELQQQAERFGTKVSYGMVTAVDFSAYPLKVTVDEKDEVTAGSGHHCDWRYSKVSGHSIRRKIQQQRRFCLRGL